MASSIEVFPLATNIIPPGTVSFLLRFPGFRFERKFIDLKDFISRILAKMYSPPLTPIYMAGMPPTATHWIQFWVLRDQYFPTIRFKFNESDWSIFFTTSPPRYEFLENSSYDKC